MFVSGKSGKSAWDTQFSILTNITKIYHTPDSPISIIYRANKSKEATAMLSALDVKTNSINLDKLVHKVYTRNHFKPNLVFIFLDINSYQTTLQYFKKFDFWGMDAKVVLVTEEAILLNKGEG